MDQIIRWIRSLRLIRYILRPKDFGIFHCGKAYVSLWWTWSLWHGKDLQSFLGILQYHSTHQIFQTHAGHLHRVIPLAIHGDEGKGKRRSNTTLVALEGFIGCKGETCGCTKCKPSWINLANLGPRAFDEHLISKTMRTNMKGHSYLQHWPLFIVPGILNKNYKPLTLMLLEVVAADLEQLFTTTCGKWLRETAHHCAAFQQVCSMTGQRNLTLGSMPRGPMSHFVWNGLVLWLTAFSRPALMLSKCAFWMWFWAPPEPQLIFLITWTNIACGWVLPALLIFMKWAMHSLLATHGWPDSRIKANDAYFQWSQRRISIVTFYYLCFSRSNEMSR